MKTLSIKQPWAWAILHGGKMVENRTWPTKYRGPVLIHVSKTFDKEGYLWILENSPKLFKSPIIMPGPTHFEMGGIIGKAEIVGCVDFLRGSPWFFGPYGFLIARPEPLPFFSCKGKLGFFEVDYPDSRLFCLK